MPPQSEKIKRITLCWVTRTERGYRYFPCIIEKHHGVPQSKHGFVMERGELRQYPVGRYVLRSYRDGKKHYEPLPACNPRDAYLSLERARRDAAASGLVVNRLAVVKHAMLAYINELGQRGTLRAQHDARLVLREFLALPALRGVYHTRSINKNMLLALHQTLRDRGSSARTIFNYDARVRAWLRWCKVPLAWLPPKPRFERKLPNVYTSEQIAALLDAAQGSLLLALLMALKLGLREREIQFAEFRDVDWEHSVFRVTGKPSRGFTIKDNEQRDIPIPADVLEALRKRRQLCPKARLIVGTRGDRPSTHLLRSLKRLAKRAGLNCGYCTGCKGKAEVCREFTLHRLRRTFATRVLQAGFSVATVQSWMGHADLASTMRYIRAETATETRDRVNQIRW